MRKPTDEIDAVLSTLQGVERHGKGLRITFHYMRKRCREVINIPVTKTNIKHVARLREAILHEIAIDTFNYAKHFPNSKKANHFCAASALREITIGELVSRYLQIKEVDIGDHTTKRYRSTLTRLAQYFDKSRPMKTLHPEDVQAWRSYLISTPRPHTGRVLLPRSVNNYMGVAACLFNWAKANNYTPQDLSSALVYVDVDRDKPNPIDLKEEASLIAATSRPMDAAWIRLAIWTGLRTGELCALAWEDIDLERGELTVRRNVTISRKFKMPKTGKARTIVLLPPAIEALLVLQPLTGIGQRHEITKTLRDGRPLSETCTFVLVPKIRNVNSVHIGCFAVDTLAGKWDRLIKRAGIQRRTQYHTRHTFASRMLTAGANPEWVAAYLGHVDSKMLRMVYGAWIPENDRAESERVWERLGTQFNEMPQKCPKNAPRNHDDNVLR
ncbi:Arm DNA-binding domain-containing protein [Aeromonas veronii]